MKKLSEVCKIVGVTRRTLQEYDNIGLIHPSAKTEAGYWMYDDSAVQLLIIIQIFIEAGYKRKDVKRIIDDPTTNIISELDDLIFSLEERRRRIDGMIITMKAVKYGALLPRKTCRALISKADMANVFKEKSFSDYWNDQVEYASDFSNEDTKDFDLYAPIWSKLVAIGLLHDNPVDAPEVIECAKSVCDSIIDMIISDIGPYEVEEVGEDEDDTKPSDVAELFGEVVTETLSDPDLIEIIEAQCGNHASTYIMEAIKAYCSSLTEEDIERWRQRIKEKLGK